MSKTSNAIRRKKILALACKIALGSGLAFYTAELLNLEFASSAGSVALLTLITTRKGTIKLSAARLITFLITAVIASVMFFMFQSEWVAYGCFTFLIVIICEAMDWRATLSVNAVIGTHFVMTSEYTPEFFMNEFMVVAIGLLFAFTLNLFQDNRGQEEVFANEIQRIERAMQKVLEEIAKYLSNDASAKKVWKDLKALESSLQKLTEDAGEYEGNTYREDARYYLRYFEMRLDQCRVLHNLQHEMQKIKDMPRQAQIIVEYIRYMNQYVTELNRPRQQLDYLDAIFQRMKEEPLPSSRVEFESRAVLYHILMDLEEFLLLKQEFVTKALPV